MLYELEILEVRRIADLAAEARKVRDRLLEKVPEAELGEPKPARGEHNPAGNIGLDDVSAGDPAFIALRHGIAELPRELREKLWAVAQIGCGDIGARDWDRALSQIPNVSDDEIMARLLGEPDLHERLRKGLYELGASSVPGDAA
jgi:uncharacterized protein DUF3775